jgi:hypothetical protein
MRAKGLSDLKNGYESASATILVRRAHWSVSNNRRICLGTLGYEPKERLGVTTPNVQNRTIRK